jgi:hypothetical protein
MVERPAELPVDAVLGNADLLTHILRLGAEAGILSSGRDGKQLFGSLCSAACVNKLWHECASSDAVWRPAWRAVAPGTIRFTAPKLRGGLKAITLRLFEASKDERPDGEGLRGL